MKIHRPMTPLRRRMLEDMQIRHYSPHIIDGYLRYMAQVAKHFGISPDHLGAPRASRRETPRQTRRHHRKIAGELGVVAIRRAPLVELRHCLRQREAGPPLAVCILPGSQ